MKKAMFLILAAFAFATCKAPTPLNGKWSDNKNSVNLTAEGTFTMKLVSDSSTRDGTYSVSNNVIAFTFSDDSSVMLSEWDIRGSVLYLYFTDDTDIDRPNKVLTLYKVG